jgi:hypothetical protein
LLKKFESGIRDSFTINQLFKQLNAASDSTDEYVLEYIQSQKNIYTRTNADILLNSGSQIAAFSHLYENRIEWSKLLGERILDSFYRKSIYHIIFNTYYYIYRLNIAAESLISTFKDRYPKYGRLQAIIFLATLNKNNVFNSISKYNEIILKYCDDDLMKELSNDEMNSIAWQIFLNSDDKKCLFIVLNLTRQSLVIDKNNRIFRYLCKHTLQTWANRRSNRNGNQSSRLGCSMAKKILSRSIR